jgi:hypothetical protein
VLLTGACHAVGPPSNPEYPSVQLPTELGAPAAPSGPALSRPSPTPEASSPGLANAKAPDAEAGASVHGDLPDPPALSERAQWLYTVDYDRGTLQVGQPSFKCLNKPEATGRRIGRFAFELWLGHELVERLRFDFPLLATETPRSGPRKPLREVPSFAPGARVSVALRVPASERATTARILDRATGDIVEVPWPPGVPDSTAARESCGKPRSVAKKASG